MRQNETWDEGLVGELHESAKVLSEMLNNTLDIAKLEEGKIEFNACYEAIDKVVDLSLGITRASAAKKGITVVTNYAKTLPQLVEIDKSRLTQIVTNLMSNAIKFTDEGKSVSLNVKWQWKCPKEHGVCEDCDGSFERLGKEEKKSTRSSSFLRVLS